MATLTGDDCHHSLNLPIINRLSGPPLRPLAGRYGIGFGPPPLPPLNGKNDSSFMVLPILLSRYIPWSTIDGQCRPRLSLPLSLYERVIYICTPNQVEPLMRWGVKGAGCIHHHPSSLPSEVSPDSSAKLDR